MRLPARVRSERPEHRRKLAQMRERVQQFVDEIVDEVQPSGKIELLNQFAFPLLFKVIFALLGIPSEFHTEARRLFNEASSLIIKVNSTPYPASSHLLRFAENLWETEELIRPIIEARRQQPQNDVISLMVEAEQRGELSEKEIYVLCSQRVLLPMKQRPTQFVTACSHCCKIPIN